jgi:integrase
MENTDNVGEVLEFDHGVRAYPPAVPGGLWRLRWEEHHRRRDTTAKDRAAAIAKAGDIVERLAVGSGAESGNARGRELIAHYLDPRRRPARVKEWSERMREEQDRYCAKYVVPIIGDVRCRELQRSDFQRILNQARTASVARQLRRTLTGVVNAGLIEGYLLPRQDVLRGVRWLPPDGTEVVIEPTNHSITEDEIPTTEAVHALAAESRTRSHVWWRELEVLLVAYSGMRWGEHAALTAGQVDAERRRITVDRQVVETRSTLRESLPKGRRRRVTMYPADTPGGVDLGTMVQRRIAELSDPHDLFFPAPRGGWARRSNYGRNLWDPACEFVSWPKNPDGRGWFWTFHSLRHVFATWALGQPNIRIEDVSRLMGHSSIRVTQEIYIHVCADVFDRFFDATDRRSLPVVS